MARKGETATDAWSMAIVLTLLFAVELACPACCTNGGIGCPSGHKAHGIHQSIECAFIIRVRESQDFIVNVADDFQRDVATRVEQTVDQEIPGNCLDDVFADFPRMRVNTIPSITVVAAHVRDLWAITTVGIDLGLVVGQLPLWP